MRNHCFLKIALFFLLTISFNSVKANDLQISNISLLNKNTVEDYLYVQFDISWDNSWRVNTGAQNWDAAWVFVKYRIDGGVWQHATLSSLDSDHNAPPEATTDASSDGKGVFMYRSSNGSGNISWSAVQFKWLYGNNGVSDNAANIEIRVFGIEMVYVNQGAFSVGDESSIGHLYDASDVSMLQSAYISTAPVTMKTNISGYTGIGPFDDNELINEGIYVDGDNGIDTTGGTTINNPDFPTGYNAFYCMKYEITQEQYVAFLNTLSRTQQDKCTHRDRGLSSPEIERNHYLLSNQVTFPFRDTVENRNGVYGVDADGISPLIFHCNVDTSGSNMNLFDQNTDGQNVGCNLIGWLQGTSYADWAALRPMTELEFEKACRGPEASVTDEYAWHTTAIFGTISEEYIFNNFGMATEYPQNISVSVGNAAYQFTTGHKDENPDRIDAPVRVGMFATASSNRITSGASYYGIMELSGSLNERCVSLGHGLGRKYQGTHGDGILADSPAGFEGNATNSDWPGVALNLESKGTNYVWNGSGYRGGDWNDGKSRLKVSERYFASLDPFGPNIGSGFRCVRTAE